MIILNSVYKKYGAKKILNDYSLTINDNDFICISGVSGVGKTTLLNILGLSERSDSGDIIFDDKKNPSQKEIQNLRRNKIGYLFQNYGLIENESVKKNLSLIPKIYSTKEDKEKIFIEALEQLGLSKNYLNKKIYTLSGGEQQRIALARLIIKKPKYIFADEPTGSLDENNRDIVLDSLVNFYKNGSTVVYVSHDTKLITQATTNIILK